MDLENFKCGFVSIVGKPNVGKSTLLNKIIGEKLSITSPKPQTTRQLVKGILTDENKQIIFLDTPGFLNPRYELHNKMLEYIEHSIMDADVLVFITDAHKFPTDYDKEMLEKLKKIKIPSIGVLNKIDLVTEEVKQEKLKILEGYSFDKLLPISAKEEINVKELEQQIIDFLPFSPPFYDGDHLSDLPMRFFAQEIIREQMFLNYSDEIPYSTAVVVESYKEFDNKVVINANIWIERKSQKGIVLGKNGEKIKKIRINAEKEIHKMVQKRVKLELWIKIKTGWRKKKNALKEFGYR